MWKFRDFTHRKGDVSRFELWGYSADDSYDYCKAVTYCQTEAGAQWAAKTLFEVALAGMKDSKLDFNIQTKKCKISGSRYNSIEVSAIMNYKPEALIVAITQLASAPPAEDLVIKPGALSVGPCAHENSDGTYVKVRFNGFSIPFYYNETEWLPTPTKKAVMKEVGGPYAEATYKVLVDNAKMLHGRALERALNLSEIDDYAQHNIRVMRDDGDGRFYIATQAELADPNTRLATVFSYGWQQSFAVIDDEVYKVRGVISGYQLANGGGNNEDSCFTESVYHIDYDNGNKEYKGYIRRKDCIPLDPRDQYVREKIGRSIKAKL